MIPEECPTNFEKDEDKLIWEINKVKKEVIFLEGITFSQKIFWLELDFILLSF